MIQAGVVGDKIEHQPQATLVEPLAQAEQRLVTAEPPVNAVAGDRETGASDVFLAEVRQCLLKFPSPLSGLRVRYAALPDRSARRSGTRPSRSPLRQSRSSLGVRNVVQRGRPTKTSGQLGQPHARVDLIERWIKRLHVNLCAGGLRTWSGRPVAWVPRPSMSSSRHKSGADEPRKRAASSATVASSRSALSATLALKAGSCLRRLADIFCRWPASRRAF